MLPATGECVYVQGMKVPRLTLHDLRVCERVLLQYVELDLRPETDLVMRCFAIRWALGCSLATHHAQIRVHSTGPPPSRPIPHCVEARSGATSPRLPPRAPQRPRASTASVAARSPPPWPAREVAGSRRRTRTTARS